MKRKMTKQELIKEEAAKTRIIIWLMFIGIIMFLSIIGMNLAADQIVHKF